MDFHVMPLGMELTQTLQNKVNNKTKPVGSLGKLEQLAVQIGRVQNTLEPQLVQPQMLVFAADHGIARSGVSAYPPEVTEQMVLNFLRGGAAVSVFCRVNGIQLKVVDAGVDAEFSSDPNLVDAKIARGTRNILEAPAMTQGQCEAAIAAGAEQIQKAFENGSNVVALGEMGIGNTSAASLLTHGITGLPLATCVGRGTGLDENGVNKKLQLLQQAVALHSAEGASPLELLSRFGGFEIAMMCGAYLQAAQNSMLILVDGFIATAAVLVASQMQPAVLDYCVFTHCSSEHGHSPVLDWLGVEALLDLDMRLGEGSGAAVAYPIVQAAVAFLNQMASFEDAGVSRGC